MVCCSWLHVLFMQLAWLGGHGLAALSGLTNLTICTNVRYEADVEMLFLLSCRIKGLNR